MIITVTPNTALDRIEILPRLVSGGVLRSTSLTLSPGGKGVNVARAVKNLGGEVTCAGFLGGFTGHLHASLTNREELSALWTWIDHETRAAIIIVDEASGEMTVINEEGPEVKPGDWDRLIADVLLLAEKADAVCLSGSLPLGLGPEAYAELVSTLNRKERSVWVDSSGTALKAAFQSKPAVVKINGSEAAFLLGWQEIQDISTAVLAARTLQQDGLMLMILTLGKLGAVLVSNCGTWYAKPPDVTVVCPIGSGDAFLGGLVLAWLDHIPEPESLRRAVAAGSANALTMGGGNFSRIEFDQVLADTIVTKIA